MYLLDGFRKSTPPQTRQLLVFTSNCENQVDDFVGGLTFHDQSIHAFCQIRTEARPSCRTSSSVRLHVGSSNNIQDLEDWPQVDHSLPPTRRYREGNASGSLNSHLLIPRTKLSTLNPNSGDQNLDLMYVEDLNPKT